MLEKLFIHFSSLLPESQAAFISSFGNFIAGLIVASIALIGVFIQLRHDRNQKKTEREMDLRKAVYLDATQAIIECLGVINKYTNIENDDEDLGKLYTKHSAVISKAHAIANEDTINALFRLNIALSESIMKVLLKRIPLKLKRSRIKMIDRAIEASQKESDGLIELMKKLNREGSKDPKSWGYVNKSFEMESENVKREIEKKEALLNTYHVELMEFGAFCFNEVSLVSRSALPDALSAIRKELDLPLNKEAYKEMIAQNYDASSMLLDEFFKQMDKAIKEEQGRLSTDD